ncbi:MAG: metal-dependent hydrolase [Mesorhizobium amorphae]|nr:MAG: metal-dependent hydrolase [Mesorhizobium amorphae]
MTGKKAVIELVTHGGSFHPDDVFAGAVLLRVFRGADLFRTRDPELTSPAPGRVVFDVGGVFDPHAGMFDHHQNGAPRRADGTAYSSFGLVWREFGEAWLEAKRVPEAFRPEIARRIDEEIVRRVDEHDNGAAEHEDPMSLITMIGDMNPLEEEPEECDQNAAYDLAVEAAGSVLERRALRLSADLENRALIEEAVADAEGGPVIVLPRSMDFGDAIHEIGAHHVLYAIYPRKAEGDWAIRAVPARPGAFENRMDLPKAWAGLSGRDLEAASGVSGSIFCHRNLFFACAETYDAIMEMAMIATGPGDPDPEP